MTDIDVLCHVLSSQTHLEPEQGAELVQVLYRLIPTHTVIFHLKPQGTDYLLSFTAEARGKEAHATPPTQ